MQHTTVRLLGRLAGVLLTATLAAQRRGVRFGRPPKLRAEQQALARRLMTEGHAAKEMAQLFGVHVATIYRMANVHPS